MTGQEGGFPQAAARFSAEVDHALTRARRAAREAKAQTAEFRRRNEELAGQAKKGKLRGVRAGEVTATTAAARAEAVEFRSAKGLPVDELPDADALIGRLPAPAPDPVAENEDYSQHQVLFDVDDDVDDDDATTESDLDFPVPPENDSPRQQPARPGPDDEDFSQQRILMDATVESYRPDTVPGSVFEPDNPDNRRSEG
jgi:hypothetical protein